MMMMGLGGDGEAFLEGDHYLYLELLDSALISYQTALTLSGDQRKEMQNLHGFFYQQNLMSLSDSKS